MKSKPPERYKAIENMTVEEHVERDKTGELPESAEYQEYVNEVHEKAGLEPPNELSKSPADLTPDEHLQQIQKGE